MASECCSDYYVDVMQPNILFNRYDDGDNVMVGGLTFEDTNSIHGWDYIYSPTKSLDTYQMSLSLFENQVFIFIFQKPKSNSPILLLMLG